jgi:hypothetical protein
MKNLKLVHMKNKIQIEVKMALMLFFIVLINRTTYSQSPPPNFVSLPSHDTTVTSVMTDTILYYGFIPESQFINARLSFPLKGNNTTNYAFSLLDQNLDTIAIVLDSNFIISYSDLSIGNQYYLKIAALINDPFLLLLGDTLIIIYDGNSICGFVDNCNLLTNSGFNDVFIPATYQNNSNPLWVNGFGTAQDLMQLHDTNQNIYSNMVCDWYRLYKDAVIGNDGIMQNYAAMWGKSLEQETIGTLTKVYPGVTYIIDYDLKSSSISQLTNANLIFGFRPYLFPLLYAPTNYPYSILRYSKQINIGTNPWSHYSDTFNLSTQMYGSIPMIEMMIYAQSNHALIPIDIGIDNIVLRPLSPSPLAPIVEGVTHICSTTDSIYNYTIANYDSLWVYFVEVSSNSKNYSKKIYTQDFELDLGFETETTVSITVCGNTTTFKVYRCCNPFQPTDNAVYFCNDTLTNNQTLDGENISICGWLTINANVIIKNSNFKFGPESGIKVGSGYTLILENDNLADGCNMIWKGIFPTDSTSKILVDSCYFEHAHSALNSYFNSKLQVINSVFENNNRGIHLRDYKPNYVTTRDGYIPPSGSNAYIIGSSFDFTNSYVNNAQHISNPIGIQIDTVYQITIGDSLGSFQKNYFNNLRYGIKSTFSVLTVINAKFSNIKSNNPFNNRDFILNQNNRPDEAAIFIEKPKLPAGSLPVPILVNTALGNTTVIVGGDSINKYCEFVNCNFGVYAYSALAKIDYNKFLNQKYNAIHILEPVSGTLVNHNKITMSSSFMIVDTNIIHPSIIISKTLKSLKGVALEVIDNRINNTRIGISLINCSSSSENGFQWVKVGANRIYFDQIIEGFEYKGIKIQGCDRIRVAGNNIQHKSLYYVGANEKALQGIHMAQCMGTWVSDNKEIKNMGAGIYVVGNCNLSQIACNDLTLCRNGIFFQPNTTQNGIAATYISQQGYSNRASDNFWTATINEQRLMGGLNSNNNVDWYFRGDNVLNNKFYIGNLPFLLDNKIVKINNTNVISQCLGLPAPNPESLDWRIAMEQRDERLGSIIREDIKYEILEDEFESYDEQYLFELLYSNPELMYLGEIDDTAYINFYNYRTNSTIAEFVEIQNLIDIENLNDALQNNGLLVAQTLIETNKRVVNDIYLNSWAQNIDYDSVQKQALLDIAMLTPYIGGIGVYSARVMLGIEPEDFHLPYRFVKPLDSIHVSQLNHIKVYPNPVDNILNIELIEIENVQLNIYNTVGQKVLAFEIKNQSSQIDITSLKSGIYYYTISGENIETVTGKINKL